MQPYHKYMFAAALESPVKIMGANLSPGKNNTVEVLCGKKNAIEIVAKELSFKKQKAEQTETVAEVKPWMSLKKTMLTRVLFLNGLIMYFLHQNRD